MYIVMQEHAEVVLRFSVHTLPRRLSRHACTRPGHSRVQGRWGLLSPAVVDRVWLPPGYCDGARALQHGQVRAAVPGGAESHCAAQARLPALLDAGALRL